MVDKTRVLLVHSNCFPPYTGGDYVYFNLYQALKQKFDVKNISTIALINLFNKKFRTVARHVINPTSVLYPFLVKKFYDLIFTSWCCDIPFFGNLVYAQPPTGYMVKVVKGCKFSPIHYPKLLSTIVDTYGTGVTWPWKKIFGWFSLKYHNFISNSYTTKNFIKLQFGKDSQIIYPPVPIHVYDVTNVSKKNIILSVGNVSLEKRFDLIGTVGIRIPEAKFILIGGSDYIGVRIIGQIEKKI